MQKILSVSSANS